MKNLKKILEQEKNRIGLVGTRLHLQQPEEGRGISEHITHDWKEIVIALRKDIDLAPNSATQEYLAKVKSADPIHTVASDLLVHGCGHRELPAYSGLGCPHSVIHHDRILDGIAEALQKKKKKGLEQYVANAFEDVLDNVNARRHTRHAGQVLFWNNEGLEAQGKFPPFYEAFVKINLAMMGKPEDATLLRRFFSNESKVQQAVKSFLNYIKEKTNVAHVVRAHERPRLFNQLFEKKHWRDLAYQFAWATADLLDQQSTQMRLCFGSDENPFDRMMRLPESQEKIAYGRYQAGEGPSKHTDQLLQLDALYRKISKAIPVKTSEYTKASGMPLVYFGRRALQEDEDISHARVKGIGLDESGKLGLRVARHVLQHPATYKVHPRNFPKLKVALLDTSGSMALSPENDANTGSKHFIPWGDNSKYHFALKGLYGIDNFLEKQGVAPYVDSEAVTFSSETTRTGRRKMRSLEERKALLKIPSGGTTINIRTFEDALSDPSFVVSISDGDILNWKGVKKKFKEVMRGKAYCPIHIGNANTFTQDVESWGIPVHYVKGDDDLSRIMIDTVSQYYRKGRFAQP
ncbi:MAG: hypothetical protein AABX86_00765 [Nanoarchaeota archaeon]